MYDPVTFPPPVLAGSGSTGSRSAHLSFGHEAPRGTFGYMRMCGREQVIGMPLEDRRQNHTEAV